MHKIVHCVRTMSSMTRKHTALQKQSTYVRITIMSSLIRTIPVHIIIMFMNVGHQHRRDLLVVDGDNTTLLRQPYVWEGQSLFMAAQRKTSHVTLKQLFQLRRIFCRGTWVVLALPAISTPTHIITLFLVPPSHISLPRTSTPTSPVSSLQQGNPHHPP